MKPRSLLMVLSLCVVALAGCAEGPDDDAEVEPPAATTPAATPPATTTPEPEGPATPPVLCTDAEPEEATGERAGYPELVFVVAQPTGEDPCDALAGPTRASAGWTAITLRNAGMGLTILPMVRLDAGRTLDEYAEATAQEVDVEWATHVGGVGGATPGESGTVLLNLREGTYVVTAVDVTDPRTPVLVRPLEVGPAEGAAAEAPEETLTVTLRDFAYDVPPDIAPGEHVIRFVNEGNESHEAPLVQLAEGATMQDFLAALGSEAPAGPPPGALIGGVNVLAPGEEAYALAALDAGAYGLVCFVPSPLHDHAPHFLLGMVAELEVAAEAG